MNLSFPKFEDLSFEQQTAVKLNYERNNLVIGAPGTGKTIVAFFRLHELHKAGKKKILMLVFNRPLMLYLKTLQNELGWTNEFEIYTVNDWVYYKLYCGSLEEPISGGYKNKVLPNLNASKYKIDWNQVVEDFENDKNLYEYIVVDEGQDFPQMFYALLVNISNNVTIFADPNQSLQDENTSIPEILAIIGKEAYFALTLNYRNSTKITDFTRRYFFDKSIFAESYIDGDDLSIEEVENEENAIVNKIKDIVNLYDDKKDIGVVLSNIDTDDSTDKNRIHNKLYDNLTTNCNGKKVQLYTNEKTTIAENNRANVDFNEKSIKIFNYMTVRGLDFDVLILVDSFTNGLKSNEGYTDKNDIKLMNRLYVASTRAKEKLHVLSVKENNKEDVHYINISNISSKFPIITNESIEECYSKAKDLYDKKEFELAFYYLHKILSIKGIVDNKEFAKNVIQMFSHLCDKFNKSDFALSIINNFAETYKVYDDQKLIYCYQNSLLDSFNWKKVYDKIDNFFKTLSNIVDINDKNALLNKFFTVYSQRLDGYDKDYAIEHVKKYSLDKLEAWITFRKYCEYVTNEKHDEEENNENHDSQLNRSEKTGHELLDGSYILVIAGTHDPEDRYVAKAKKYGFIKEDFEFFFDYDKMTNHDFNIRKMSDKPKAIILGSNPHSIRGKGDYRSLNAMLSEPGYPKLFVANQGKSFSVSAFGRILDKVTNYLIL